MHRKILRLAILVLALATVPSASADTPTTTTPRTSPPAAVVSSTAPHVEYWLAMGAVHFDYVSRDALCADAVYVFRVDAADGAINGVLPGDPTLFPQKNRENGPSGGRDRGAPLPGVPARGGPAHWQQTCDSRGATPVFLV